MSSTCGICTCPQTWQQGPGYNKTGNTKKKVHANAAIEVAVKLIDEAAGLKSTKTAIKVMHNDKDDRKRSQYFDVINSYLTKGENAKAR